MKTKLHLLLALFALFSTPAAKAITFTTWVASYSLTGDDAAADADPDDDGIPNLMEFALSGMSPIVSDRNHASMPRLAFFTRTGEELGDWEFASYDAPPTDGLGGVYHAGLVYTIRADAEGILRTPELSDRNTMLRWFGGRCAFTISSVPGNIRHAVAITQAQRNSRMFFRLNVMLAEEVP